MRREQGAYYVLNRAAIFRVEIADDGRLDYVKLSTAGQNKLIPRETHTEMSVCRWLEGLVNDETRQNIAKIAKDLADQGDMPGQGCEYVLFDSYEEAKNCFEQLDDDVTRHQAWYDSTIRLLMQLHALLNAPQEFLPGMAPVQAQVAA
jgi:hypothetical protein